MNKHECRICDWSGGLDECKMVKVERGDMEGYEFICPRCGVCVIHNNYKPVPKRK